jgi:hypothetical protein
LVSTYSLQNAQLLSNFSALVVASTFMVGLVFGEKFLKTLTHFYNYKNNDRQSVPQDTLPKRFPIWIGGGHGFADGVSRLYGRTPVSQTFRLP